MKRNLFNGCKFLFYIVRIIFYVDDSFYIWLKYCYVCKSISFLDIKNRMGFL